MVVRYSNSRGNAKAWESITRAEGATIEARESIIPTKPVGFWPGRPFVGNSIPCKGLKSVEPALCVPQAQTK